MGYCTENTSLLEQVLFVATNHVIFRLFMKQSILFTVCSGPMATALTHSFIRKIDTLQQSIMHEWFHLSDYHLFPIIAGKIIREELNLLLISHPVNVRYAVPDCSYIFTHPLIAAHQLVIRLSTVVLAFRVILFMMMILSENPPYIFIHSG